MEKVLCKILKFIAAFLSFSESNTLFYNLYIQRHDFKGSYVIYKSQIRRKKAVIAGYKRGEEKEMGEEKEVDALMIIHKYDTQSLYLTFEELYENPKLSE